MESRAAVLSCFSPPDHIVPKGRSKGRQGGGFTLKELFTGSGVALVTPFREGRVDLAAFDALVERQIDAGTDALIVLGTTGEPTSLTAAEKALLVDHAVHLASGKAQVIVGAGGNCTANAISDAKMAQELGADAILSVTPYYVKCGDSGLLAHYTAIADSVELPVILYNVPSRTGVNLKPEVAAKLVEHPRIRGVKEASGSYPQIAALLEAVRGRASVYCGTDELNQTMLAMGAQGLISVTANVAPKQLKRLADAAMQGEVALAARLQAELEPLNEALFLEGNPVPVKAVLAELGLIRAEYRLPLVPPTPETLERIRAVLARAADNR